MIVKMNSKRERICRLCLKAAKNAFREIGGVVKQILGVLLLKLDLDITRDPIICEDCMEVANKFLDFKSTCIDTEEIIVLFSTDREKTRHNIRDIYGEKERLTFFDEHLNICRFCFSRLERNNYVSLDSLMSETMVEMLLEYMPETDLNVIENPIICTNCRENLDSYFMFVTGCLDTESKIKAYCKEVGTDSTGEVTLRNVLHFLFGYILQNPKEFYQTCKIKQEPNMFKDVDLVRHEPQSELVKLEEELDIKEEEITLEESLSEIMFDKYENTFLSNKHDGTKPDSFFLETNEDKTERRSHQEQSQVKVDDTSNMAVFKLSNDSNDSQIDKRILCSDETRLKMKGKQKNSDLITNSNSPEESLCNYTLCSSKQQLIWKTPARSCEGDYNKPISNHQEQEDASKQKQHKCSLCPYRAEKKSSVATHMLFHMDPSEIERHKCPLCDFEGKYKSNITTHMKVHQNDSEIKIYKCSLCTYESHINKKLIRHMLVHKNVLKVKLFACSLCSFKSKDKVALKRHMLLMHRNIPEIEMFKCTLCAYKSRTKAELEEHMLVHKDISEIEMYKCSLCTYESKSNAMLIRHMLVHKNVLEVKLFACSLCSFKSEDKVALKRHMLLMHRNIPEIEMFKCTLCAYKSRTKAELEGHMLVHHVLVHRDIPKIKKFKCALCAYKSTTKGQLTVHMSVHKDIFLEIELYKCSLCIFETKHMAVIKNHMLIHTNV